MGQETPLGQVRTDKNLPTPFFGLPECELLPILPNLAEARVTPVLPIVRITRIGVVLPNGQPDR